MNRLMIYAVWGIALAMGLGCMTRATEELPSSGQWEEAAFDILSAEVNGDALQLTIQYGGGCGAHQFEGVSAGPLMKSMPPKQPLKVVHRTTGDPCRALIEEELTIELKPWRAAPHGVTVILLENWNNPLIYEYD